MAGSSEIVVEKSSRVYIAGYTGLVGSAIINVLIKEGYCNVITKSSKELDLRVQSEVADFFEKENPEYVILAAAKVGGIYANTTYPAQFIYDNLAIQTNVIHQSYLSGVKKLLYFGSSCIYPKDAPQPLREDYLLTGSFEPTNEPYAVSKIAGIRMCQAYNKQYGTNFISVVPANLYGPGDNFDLKSSHVLAALIRRFHEAKDRNAEYVEIWGSGKPRRDFLFVEDLADACLFLLDKYDESEIINVGSGEDISILLLAEVIKNVVGFKGEVLLDQSKPDGMQLKMLDNSKISTMGWKKKYSLKEGIKLTYRWFVEKLV